MLESGNIKDTAVKESPIDRQVKPYIENWVIYFTDKVIPEHLSMCAMMETKSK